MDFSIQNKEEKDRLLYELAELRLKLEEAEAERERALRSLEISQREFRLLLDKSPVAMVFTEGPTKFIFNEKFTELFGYTSEDIGSLDEWWTLAYPDKDYRYRIRTEWNQRKKEANAGSGEMAMEAIVTCKRGLDHHIEFRYSFIGGRNIVALIDLTERKRAEKEILEQYLLLESILNGIPDIAWLKDMENRFLAVNEPFAKICGKTPEELIGKTDYDIWPKQLAERYRVDDLEVITSGRQKRVEEPLAEINGGRRWIETIKTPVLNNKGEIIGTTGIARDITERKQIEEELGRYRNELEKLVHERSTELTESESLFSDVVKTAQEGIWLVDNQQKIFFVNESMSRMLGYSKEEMLGKKVTEFFTEDFLPEFKERWENRRRGISEQYDIKLRAKDGSEVYGIISASPRMNAKGGFIGSVAIILDITERKRLESVAEALNLTENLGFIFSGIRHEIGNPVNASMLSLMVLKKKLGRISNEEISEYLDISLDEMGRVSFLLKSLKNYNVYEDLQITSVDMRAFLEKFKELVKADFKKRRIRIEFDLAPGPLLVLADERALHQIMLNLFTNSADALSGREGPRIKIKIIPWHKLIRIQVEDNGAGISERQMKTLFKPFYTTKPKGTGLGLIIVKKLMAKMKGDVEITSQKDKGTIATLSLPQGEPVSGNQESG